MPSSCAFAFISDTAWSSPPHTKCASTCAQSFALPIIMQFIISRYVTVSPERSPMVMPETPRSISCVTSISVSQSPLQFSINITADIIFAVDAGYMVVLIFFAYSTLSPEMLYR